MGKVISIWGSPNSGKTAFATTLGTAIYDTFQTTVAVIYPDLDAVSTDFDFTEKGCGVQLNLNSGKTAMLKFGKNDVRIENAYLYNDADSIAELLLFARYYASRAGYKIERTNAELIGEYRLHTILYRMG